MLVTLWTADPGRFTRDVDFLGFGAPDNAHIRNAFSSILAIEADDGLVFGSTELTLTDIREDQVYGGKRLRSVAELSGAKIPITIDIGFGDVITAPEFEIEYTSLLDFDSARIRAYSPATVIAEKFHAVVALGLVNGRMKDFYDLWSIPRVVEVRTSDLSEAIRATFHRRETPIPAELPAGLSRQFAELPTKAEQWSAFSASTSLEGKNLAEIVGEIWVVIEPAVRAARQYAGSPTEP